MAHGGGRRGETKGNHKGCPYITDTERMTIPRPQGRSYGHGDDASSNPAVGAGLVPALGRGRPSPGGREGMGEGTGGGRGPPGPLSHRPPAGRERGKRRKDAKDGKDNRDGKSSCGAPGR